MRSDSGYTRDTLRRPPGGQGLLIHLPDLADLFAPRPPAVDRSSLSARVAGSVSVRQATEAGSAAGTTSGHAPGCAVASFGELWPEDLFVMTKGARP